MSAALMTFFDYLFPWGFFSVSESHMIPHHSETCDVCDAEENL